MVVRTAYQFVRGTQSISGKFKVIANWTLPVGPIVTASRLSQSEAKVLAMDAVSSPAPLLDDDNPGSFAKLTDQQMELLARHETINPIQAGEILFREGDATYNAMVLLEGLVAVVLGGGEAARELAMQRSRDAALSADVREREPWFLLGRAPFLLETSRPCVFAVGDVRSGSTRMVAAPGRGDIAMDSSPNTSAAPRSIAARRQRTLRHLRRPSGRVLYEGYRTARARSSSVHLSVRCESASAGLCIGCSLLVYSFSITLVGQIPIALSCATLAPRL